MTYQKLLEEINFPNGGKSPSAIVMAPMEAKGANLDGSVSQADLDYFSIRTKVAGLIITGAMNVNMIGRGFKGQIGIFDDKFIPGLKELAQTIKKDGSKAIAQLYHAGREADITQNGGVAAAPTEMEFPFLNHRPRELSASEIEETIKDFGRAAKRAIDAGFDGVEIHGANHYLLQQFFSSYSNHRTDKWGGSLANRMNFPLAVAKEVCRVVDEYAPEGFIVGYRISPDEIHEETIGYTVDDSMQLVDALLKQNKLDYIHISLFTHYDAKPDGHDDSYAALANKVIKGRAKLIIVSGVSTADDALDALNEADLVAIGRAALVEPAFTQKIKDGKTDTILTKVENLEELNWPDDLIEWYRAENSPLPPIEGI
ncbi:NADH-dependent flavin oxidoreductase [Streptococcus caviae]|uniref:NADH-dependent flavin oxidoreductase n=1 Tax=Streptococcus sp. 'caviae' TaxID=1915004 RepID=UPI00094BAF77|nr:NADH-dependent flavin oxidoreductase [Streptococcus sp. 'caviae']OLN82540.1 hypothetical protein BMI76_08730 [Streptococcus sp. 'caviae']